MTNAHALRLQLLQAGYLALLPLFGKAPPQLGKNNAKKGLAGWQKIEIVTPEMLDMWDKTWPDAQNTGVLTRTMPTLDVDILDEAAAKACQDFIRERYEDAGHLLFRVGKPPKFAVPFRCNPDEAFKKIVINLIAPDGSEGQKIEFLADGEQVVVAGEHPETRRAYVWSNGGLEQVKHEDLPYTRNAEADALANDLVDKVLTGFGYKRAPSRPKSNGTQAPRDGGGGGDRDWTHLFENIRLGRELHDSITILAAKIIASGTNSGAAINQLRGLMDASEAPKDERWRARVSEIPAAVDSAVAKYGKGTRSSSPASEAPTSDAAKGGSFSHIWRSKDYDYPCTPTGEEQHDDAGRIYVQVRTPDGSLSFVLKDKLVPKPEPKPKQPKPEPAAIEDAIKVFKKWLVLSSTTPVRAMLGTVAANLLPGDPVWLGLIGPPSSAKSELLNSISELPNVVDADTITPSGLLSGTPKKQQDIGARGGLLRQIGSFGIITLKDFGSVLSMHAETRQETLAALRKIYDGAWTRHLGSAGGKTLTWKGKVALVFAATEIIDAHHSVISSMGDRFLLSRLKPVTGKKQFTRALKHTGTGNNQMRKELAAAVKKLFAKRRTEASPISTEETEAIGKAIALAVRLRGAVARDFRSRDIEAIYGAEGTARIGLALERLLAGLDTLGMDRAKALKVVEDVALDSAPPLRRRAYECVCKWSDKYQSIDTSDVAIELGLPTTSVRRILEDLEAHGLITHSVLGQGHAHKWLRSSWEADEAKADAAADAAED